MVHGFPVEEIIHRILPSMATANRLLEGEFTKRGLPYIRSELHLLSGIIQYFGTSGGRDARTRDMSDRPRFQRSRRFLLYLELEKERDIDMDVLFVYQGTVSYKKLHANRVHNPFPVSSRESALIRGCMYWLGQKNGQRFLKEFEHQCRKARERMDRRSSAERGLQKAA